jgi:hypothetical protein
LSRAAVLPTAAALPPLLSTTWPPGVDPEAFFRVRVRCRSTACAMGRPDAPLGLVLLLQHASWPLTRGSCD